MKQRVLYTLMIVLSFFRASAQDPHFTQTGTLGSWFNPASIAPTEEPYRLQAVYRNQWASTGSPFITQGFFAERRLSEHALGVHIVSTGAGAGSLKQTSAGLQWSFTRQWGIHRFSGGVHGGFMQRSLETRGMTFDEQYDADQGFDPSVPSGESFAALRTFSHDFGTGFRWHVPADSRRMLSPFAGIGVHHLSNKSERYLINSDRIAQRISCEAGTGIALGESCMIRTSILHLRQGSSRAWQFSVSPEWLFSNGTGFGGSFVYRAQDAIALAAQVRWNKYGLGLSYDINTSGIQGSPGSVEVVLSYRPAGKPRAVKRMLTQQENAPVKDVTTPLTTPEEMMAMPLLTSIPMKPVDEVLPVSKSVTPFMQVPQASETIDPLEAMILLPAVQISTRIDAAPVGRILVMGTSMPIQRSEESIENGNSVAGESSTADVHKTEAEAFDMGIMEKKKIDSGYLLRSESEFAMEPKSTSTSENVWIVPEQHIDDEWIQSMALLTGNITLVSPMEADVIALVVQPMKTGDVIGWRDDVDINQMPMRREFNSPPISEINAEPVSTSGINTSFTPPVDSETSESVQQAQYIDESILVPFGAGSLRVHGLSKLDIIEPALDRVLDNPGLRIELSGVSSNGNLNEQRSVIVRQILVSKGLDPARIRIVTQEASGVAGKDAVRLNILVNR